MQLVDYHVHTELCGHAVGSMQEYVEHALRVELSELGFSDHYPVFHLADDDPRRLEYGMSSETLPEYVWRVTELRLDYPEIPIRLGIEIDYVPGYEEKMRGWLDEYPFDYVIGSVHFIDDWSVDDPRHLQLYEAWSLDRIWEEYFKRVQWAARCGLFDVIGHVDLVKKFGQRPQQPLDDLYQETVEALAEAGVCIELNTAGLRAPVHEQYPSRKLLQLCSEYGIGLTLGSDAHRPDEVGKDLGAAVRLAESVGYDRMVTFQERERDCGHT